MTTTTISLKRSAALFTLIVFSISTVAAATPSEDVKPSNPGEDIPEQKPEDVAPGNQTGGGPLSNIPGLSNETLPMTIQPPELPELPEQASDMAKTVTDTISNAFNGSIADFSGGIGSFLSENLPGTNNSDDGNGTVQPPNGNGGPGGR